MCRRWLKLCQGVRGRGHLPPASPCQVLCGCHVTGPTRTPTGGAYHSPLERRPGSERLREPVCRPPHEPAQSQVLPHPVPIPLPGEGPGMGPSRGQRGHCPWPAVTRWVRREPAEPLRHVRPMEAPPHLFRLLPLGVFLSEPQLSLTLGGVILGTTRENFLLVLTYKTHVCDLGRKSTS